MKLKEAARIALRYLTASQKAVQPAPEDSPKNWGEILHDLAEGLAPPFEAKGIVSPFGAVKEQSISHYVAELGGMLSLVAA